MCTQHTQDLTAVNLAAQIRKWVSTRNGYAAAASDSCVFVCTLPISKSR
jgi:hypothetical protein